MPFEDDPQRGKDRPVLLIARGSDVLYGLMLTSKDHDRDAADEARYGRYWMDVGSGGWPIRRGQFACASADCAGAGQLVAALQ